MAMRHACVFAAVLALAGGATADDPVPPRADAIDRVRAIADAMLEHHSRPSSRQELVLQALRAAYERAGVPEPDGLARRFSAVATPEQLAALVDELWPAGGEVGEAELAEALVDGALAAVPGRAEWLSDRERAVQEQFAGNRYVGLQIAAAYDDERKLTRVAAILAGGPAERAGMKEGDLFEAIDGEPQRGRPLRDVVERLRGDEGTTVDLTLRRDGQDEPIAMTVRREAMPRQTVQEAGELDAKLPAAIGYLRITDLSASTAHELRRHEARLRTEGKRALILDLRGTVATDPHSAVLVADSLLGDGPIGRERTARGVREHRSGADCVFRGWPMIGLTNAATVGPAEWLAAALKDRGRATLVGSATRGVDWVRSTVPLGDGRGWISLRTGTLERIDGRPLADPLSPAEEERRAAAQAAMAAGTLVMGGGQGVQPDEVAGLPGPGAPGPVGPRPPFGTASSPPPGSAGDAVFKRAVERLQEGLNRPAVAEGEER